MRSRVRVAPAVLLALLAALAGSVGHTPATAVVDQRAGPAAATPAEAARQRAGPPRVGAYVDGMQSDPAAFTRFEQLLGARLDIASYYYGFGDVFPGATELTFADGGTRDVLLSWDMGPTRFSQWARGRYDGYLRQVARAAASYPYVVYVRPWPEMNGDWQDFQPTKDGKRRYGGTYQQFVRAWRHVVSYTRQNGATNLRWVFDPTADTYPETTRVDRIWPGRRYVDVLGIDGYNWGADSGFGQWRSFGSIFTEQYRRLTKLDPTDPVWVCEFGSKEPLIDDGAPVDPLHSKGAWLADALAYRQLPRLEAMVFFDIDKERDWRVTSSQESLDAVRASLAARG